MHAERLARHAALVAVILASAVMTAIPAWSAHDPSPTSEGIYRIPYENGTEVFVTNDHHDHSPVRDRIDMSGVNGVEPYRIVAAASGTIRFIQDDNTQANDDCQFNNYVWIEHPNGEWTKYSHMTADSTEGDAGLSVGDVVAAGTFLGFEDEIGCASGKHLHFEVAVPDDPANPIDPVGGFIIGENRVPVICDIPDNTFLSGETYTAADCGPQPEPAVCGLIPPPGPAAIMALPGVVTLGTPGPDVIYGTTGPDRIAGMGGDDVIFGLAGDDQLAGGDGDDTLCGGAGSDRVAGGNGQDVLDGGGGDDEVAGYPGDDELYGGLGTDKLAGGDGTDTCLPGEDAGDAAAGCE